MSAKPTEKKKKKKAETPHKAFAKRFNQAIENIPDVPPEHYGRLKFIVERLDAFGLKVSQETVRKWKSAETLPKHSSMEQLAEFLKVDHSWLAFGTESISPTMSALNERTVFENGAITLLAGFIQIGGGTVLQASGDEKADLRAVIRGAQYSLRVIVGQPEGDGYQFDVPADTDTTETLIVGIIVQGGMSVEVYEIESELFERSEKRDAFKRVRAKASDLRRIEGFAKRL